MASSFIYMDTDIGVVTAARAPTVAHCTQRVTEPLIRLPKSSVVTWLPLAGSSKHARGRQRPFDQLRAHARRLRGAVRGRGAGAGASTTVRSFSRATSTPGRRAVSLRCKTWRAQAAADRDSVQPGTLALLRPRSRPHPRARPGRRGRGRDRRRVLRPQPGDRRAARVALIAARAITALPYAPRRDHRTRGFPMTPHRRHFACALVACALGMFACFQTEAQAHPPRPAPAPARPAARRRREAAVVRSVGLRVSAGADRRHARRAVRRLAAQHVQAPAHDSRCRRRPTSHAPNADFLYSQAWLDLSKGPVILTVPETKGRYYLLALLDAYTNVAGVDRQAHDRHGEALVRHRRPGLQGRAARGHVGGPLAHRSRVDLRPHRG